MSPFPTTIIATLIFLYANLNGNPADPTVTVAQLASTASIYPSNADEFSGLSGDLKWSLASPLLILGSVLPLLPSAQWRRYVATE